MNDEQKLAMKAILDYMDAPLMWSVREVPHFIARAETKLAEEIEEAIDCVIHIVISKSVSKKVNLDRSPVFWVCWRIKTKGSITSSTYNTETFARLAAWYAAFCWWQDQKHKEGE